jgi:hypothetical protein
MTSTEPDETFDSIPWERLLADPADRRRRLITGLSIGLAVLAVSVSLTRTLWPVPDTAIVSSQPFDDAAPPVTTSTTAPRPVPSPQPLISEADLLAVDPEGAMRAAAGLAEWFFSEYFTVDTPGRWGAVADSVLPVGIGAPPEGTRTFVDSVHVLSTEQTGSDRFLVTAVVRRLVDRDGSGFERVTPDRFAVEVVMGATGPVVTGPPRPVAGEAIGAGSGPDWEEVPPAVEAAATEQVAALGLVAVTPAGGVSAAGARLAEGWSVVLLVADPAGMTWPVTVTVLD